MALAASAAGCSAGETEPSTLPPVESGSAAGPSPTVSARASTATGEPKAAQPPLSPSATATAATPAGASAFARYYVESIGQAFATADSTGLRAATLPGCEGCEAIIGAVDSLRPLGQRRIGGEYAIVDVAAPAFENGDVVLLLTYTRTAGQIVNGEGVVVDSAPAVPLTTAQMRLLHRQGRWFVQGYRVV